MVSHSTPHLQSNIISVTKTPALYQSQHRRSPLAHPPQHRTIHADSQRQTFKNRPFRPIFNTSPYFAFKVAFSIEMVFNSKSVLIL